MTPPKPVKRVRLVKVLVQPVVMLDDGETLRELHHGIIAIPAGEWPEYSGARFARELKAWEERLAAGEDADGMEPDPAPEG